MISLKNSILGMLAISTAASSQAQYSVANTANGWSTAWYNWNGHVGAYTQLAGFGSPTATVSPWDNTGLATTATCNVSGNGSGYPHNPNTFDIVSSSVDLSSVSTSMSEYDTATDGVYTGNDGGTTTSQMSDHLTFHVAGATGSTVTQIGYTYTVSGHMKQSGSNPTGTGEGLGSWSLGIIASGMADVKLDSTSNYQAFVNGTAGTGTFSTSTPGLLVQTGFITILGTSLSSAFDMSFQGWGSNGMDMGYGSHLEFSLPSEVTIESSSGVFGSSSPVPEPQSMVAVATGAICFFARRRKYPRA